MADSAAEYFDASDDVLCGSSSELSDESGLSDGSTTNSEPEEGHGGYTHKVRIIGQFLANLTFLDILIPIQGLVHNLPYVYFEYTFMALKFQCNTNMFSVKASATRKYRASISKTPNCIVPKSTGRRTKLPAVCPDNSHVGLMAILYNNIGKKPASC